MPSVSLSQRRFFAIVYAYKIGKISLSELKRRYTNWRKIKQVADSMSIQQIKKYLTKPSKRRRRRR